MKKIYLVKGIFEEFDLSAIINIGIFTEYSEAYSIKEKWELFFKENKSILKRPEHFESLSDEDDWYTKSINYPLINSLYKIDIEEIIIDTDNFIENFSTTQNLKTLLETWNKSWTREKNLNNIL